VFSAINLASPRSGPEPVGSRLETWSWVCEQSRLYQSRLLRFSCPLCYMALLPTWLSYQYRRGTALALHHSGFRLSAADCNITQE